MLERNVYTLLDLLSDIGGIQGLLVSFFAITVTMLNADRFEEHLIGQLFTYRPTGQNQKYRESEHDKESNPCNMTTEYFKPIRLFGFKCCHRRRDRELRALVKARDQLNKEADIVELLRFMRLLKKVIYKSQSLHDKEASKIDSSLNKDCRFSVIELSDSDSENQEESLNVNAANDPGLRSSHSSVIYSSE